MVHRLPPPAAQRDRRQPPAARVRPDGLQRRRHDRPGDHAGFADNNAFGWRTYGGTWGASGGRYAAANSLGGKALLDTNFGNVTYDADVAVTSGGGDAGLIFRVTNATTGTDGYTGYYAGISPAGRVVLGRVNNNWTQLQATAMTVAVGATYKLRVTAIGSSIKVYVDDMVTPKINVTDATYPTGATGLRVFNAAAAFDNVSVSPPVGSGTNLAQGRPATGTTACQAAEGRRRPSTAPSTAATPTSSAPP
ncbi:family 16 glycoside hydrolase [Catellatospora coxensis]